MTFAEIGLTLLAVGLGGFVKGALGAGAPIVAIPILSILVNVPFAVAVMALPNLLSNVWQAWALRRHLLPPRFVLSFAICGALGAGIGTFGLAWLPERPLMLVLASVLAVYLLFRLARPGWKISETAAQHLVIPAGMMGGILQGAAGISAPVSITFLNAMRLERAQFIATISIFFVAMSVVQLPTLWNLGILGATQLYLSLMALVPLFGAMPLGTWAARKISRLWFDRLILALLAIVAVRLFWVGLALG